MRTSRISGLPAPRGRSGLVEPLMVLDLGAGAFHLTQATFDQAGDVKESRADRRPVRMLEPLRTGHIDDASWGVGMGALAGLVGAVPYGPGSMLVAVASSWFGELDNGAEFLAEVRGCLAAPVEALTGVDEARLVWSAARGQAPAARGPVAVLSIGASAVRLAVGLGEMCLFAASLPLGALRLRARFLGAGRPLDAEAVRAIADMVVAVAGPAGKELRGYRPATLLLAGGTCRTLARLGHALPESSGARVFRRHDAAALVALLSGGGAQVLGGCERADSLGPAAVVLSTLLAVLGIEEGEVVPASLSGGVILRERRHGQRD